MKLNDTLASTLIAAAILAGGGSLVTVAVLADGAGDVKARVEKVEDRQRVIEKNQVRLGEAQRHLAQDSEWTQRKLEAIADAVGAPTPPRPDLPPPVIVETPAS